MKVTSVAALLGLSALAVLADIRPRDYDANDYYVLHLDADTSPAEVARHLGLAHEGTLGELRDHHVFVAKKTSDDVVRRHLVERRRRKRDLHDSHVLDGVKFAQKQRLRKPWEKRIPPRAAGPAPAAAARNDDGPVAALVEKQRRVALELGIADPIFDGQWHLLNTRQAGHDVNVTDVWRQGITGKNATVAIVDDGLDMYSLDLRDNYYAEGSYDFNDKTKEPRPRLSDDRHGTRCAGEVAAVKNDVCGVGVAYDARIAGLRILSKLITDADEAVAMNFDYEHNQIYSCSWGPPDDGRSMDAPGILIRRAMLNAVQNGRGGLGSIYVFASGNGASYDDNCNFDGYTNSIYSITVGAIDRNGDHPPYSEACSAGLVVTYSSGGGDAIHTTDVGQNACYSGHGGTSAAAPLAAGIFALVLQVRPDLSWRDMQYLAMETAVPVHLDSGDWQNTTIGRKFSHTYGYGKIDSYAIVEAAKTWKNVKPQAWFFSPWVHVNQSIPQGNQGVAVSFEVTRDMLKDANLARVEHVTVTMNIDHTRRGDLSVDLISPDKVVSHLSVTRSLDDAHEGYVDWTFMSVAHWGESGVGTWTVIVKDTKVNDNVGTFVDWHLKLWGESIDASKAKLLPMPTEEDDDDHDVIATTTIPATTTTLPPQPEPTVPNTDAHPSDQPERPTHNKPTSVPSPPDAEEEVSDPQASGGAANGSNSHWLPSFLPTFGVSASTQAWIYGALGLIVVFCSGLGVYLFMARRKRLRNSSTRDGYEFELLDEEEAEGLNGGGRNAGAGGEKRGKARKTRGGELYDAFAGGSEDEEDDEERRGELETYRDRSDDGVAGEPMSEKRGIRHGSDDDDDDEELHHVIADSEDESDEEVRGDDDGRRPLRR